MRFRDTLKLSTRMFKTNPSRTWLTIMGMGVGTGAVVMLVGLGFGLQGILLEQIILGETLLSLNVSSPNAQIVELNDATIADLTKVANVKDVAPLATFPSLATYEGLTGNIALRGASPAYFRYAGLSKEQGELFNEEDARQDADSVLISSGALKLFNTDAETVLGKTLSFRVLIPRADNPKELQEVQLEKKYKIKGIINSPSSIDAYLLLSELKTNFKIETYERAQVRVEASEFLNIAQEVIVNKGFRVTALSKTVEQANKIFQGVQGTLATFGGIALIVSAIGMFNTMTVTLLERTGEIGIMRTIGASPRDIRVLFLSEAMIVGFLGGVIGILMGVAVGLIINTSLNALASRFGGVSMSLFRYPFFFLLFISSFSAIVGFATGVFPATRASKLNPLDAIRYK